MMNRTWCAAITGQRRSLFPVSGMLAGRLIAVLAFCFFLLVAPMHAQLTTGSLSGTVADSTGAVVPNARVTLVNEASHDTRQTTSNSAGYFTFAAVQPGSYTVTVEANGFNIWKQTGVPMNPGDIREVSGIRLTTGGGTTTVEVQAAAAQILPIDSGERAAVLSSKDIERLALEGRNVSELLKVLPGVTTVSGGTSGGSSIDFSASAPTGSTIGVGLSMSGAPYRGGTAYMLDGANIIDPGCNCYSIAVPNPDMTEEVKVQNSFGADSPNGPAIVNVISKSGAAQFHGEGYFYARNAALNANTWLNNNSGIQRQDGEYYYPGGNIGGPVRIPGTSFNTNNKLLFWAGYEYYKQTLPASQPFESYIPSPGMMAGNFTASGEGNAQLCPNGFSSSANNWCNDLSGATAPDGTPITGGVIPAKYLDPGASALMKMFPQPNANPATTPGGYNYIEPITNDQNGYVFRARVDYNLNDNTKFFATYQQGNTTFITPGHVWWTPAYSIPYPGGNITSPNTSRVVTANLVNVLTPTLTNEFVFGWGWDDGPFNPSKLSAIYKSALGYPYATVYNTASQVAPSINSAGAQTFPDISQPAFFGTTGSYPLRKAIPSFADNVTKVWRSHTFKLGAFTELVGNRQGVWSYPNGALSFGSSPESNNVAGSQVASGTKIGSSNPTANLVMGIASAFSQNNYVPVQDMAYRTTAGYVMDNWHVNSRLNLNLGVRFDHIGRWYDRQGTGLAVWLPQLYQQDVAANQAAGSMVVEYPGIRWHAIDKSIRNAGSPVDWAYVSPRFGFAYDFSGNGNTVFRGGWGEYRWNDEPASASALSTSQNMQSYNSPGGQAITLSQIALQTPSGNAMPAGSVTAMDYNDHRMPLTYSWNLTVDQQLPWKTMLEMAYVGNSSDYLLMGGQTDGSGIGGSEFSNLNKIPVGGLFKADPVTGAAAPADPDNTGSYSLADYMPYSGCTASGACYGYGTNSVTVHEHTGYSNYHGLQVAWLKQSGRLSFDFNYTWSKSMGIISSTLDAFHVHGNYGILAIDRPQVFNASWAYDLGSVYHGGFLLMKGIANGWTISGINTFQSGGNLQSNSSQNLGLTIYGKDANGNTEQLTSKTWFGTDANAILPIATCDPRSGLRSHQLLNLSCFSAPQIGQQGVRQFHPYLNGPWYTDSDLSVYKTFSITERQKVQFRASAFNFMNHPLWGFSGNNLLTLKYNTPDRGHTFTTDASTLGLASTDLWGVMNQKAAYSGAGYNRIVELSLKYTF
ncbi:MAG: carboxypeptidase-like regulatory domain-containing protein [Bacillota bacterium]|nr:carboxypeptidase-like regulatory domain-containing protein [Bacillota bacterium]